MGSVPSGSRCSLSVPRQLPESRELGVYVRHEGQKAVKDLLRTGLAREAERHARRPGQGAQGREERQ